MGVIKDGYYYPRPEEIYIGYQCEVNWNRGYEEVYSPMVVRVKDENGAYVDDLEKLTRMMDDGCTEARVPVLSKEDIEGEGWKKTGGFWWEWPIEYELYCDEISNRPVDWRLNWMDATRYLRIECYERNSFEWETAYMGPCPTVNELRYLMRLFNIKIQ